MAKTWRRLAAKARQQLSDERLIIVFTLVCYKVSKNYKKDRFSLLGTYHVQAIVAMYKYQLLIRIHDYVLT
jgi:hypothetical protein